MRTRDSINVSPKQRVRLVKQRCRDIGEVAYAFFVLVCLGVWAYYLNAGMLTHKEKLWGFIGWFVISGFIAAVPSLGYKVIGRWSIFDEAEADKVESV